MTHRILWALAIAVIAVITTSNRFDANAQRGTFDQTRQLQNVYGQLLVKSGADIPIFQDKDDRTGMTSAIFRTAACDADYQIFEQDIRFTYPHALRAPLLGNKQQNIIYYDKVWANWDRIGATLQAIKISLAHVVGATRFYPSKTMLILVIPDNCDDLSEIDWAQVWRKGNHQSGRGAT